MSTKTETLFKVKFFGISTKVVVWVHLSADTPEEDIVDAAISEATNDGLDITISSFDTIMIGDQDKPDSEYEYSPDDE